VLFAQVIQMLHAVLGAEQFREGLVVYMKRHQYGNTETTDLWQARP
jgi:aminopeptidase N